MKTKNPQKSTKGKKGNLSKNTYSNLQPLVKTFIFGVGVTNGTSRNILEYIIDFLQKTQKNMYIVTPNPEMIMLAQKNEVFKNALNEASLALCDGIGLLRAGQLVGKPFKERIIGTNFVESLCEKVADWPITVGFLGGRPGVAERAAECLKARFPGLQVVFAEAEWDESRGPVAPHPQNSLPSLHSVQKSFGGPPSRTTSSPENTIPPLLMQTAQSIPESNFSSLQNGQTHGLKEYKLHSGSKIQNQISKIDILFVAFGAPKQELWMAQHINKVPVRVMMGVGGALDQIVDKSLRPPMLIHSLNLGWLYRLIREPWRIKRQAVLVPFMWLVLREKLK